MSHKNEIQRIKRLIKNHHRRLQALEERKALYGIDTPLAILTEMEDIRAEIEDLHEQLQDLEQRTDNLEDKSEKILATENLATGKVTKRGIPWMWIGLGTVVVVAIISLTLFFTLNNREQENPREIEAVALTAEVELPTPTAVAVTTSTNTPIPPTEETPDTLTPDVTTDMPTPEPKNTFTLTPVTQEERLNSMINESFEEEFNDDLWKIYGEMDFSRSGYSGNFAFNSVQNLSSDDERVWAGLSQRIEIVSNQTYDFYVWLKWAYATNPHISVQWYDKDGIELGHKNVVWGFGEEWGSDRWEGKGGKITAPAEAHFAEIYILHGVITRYGKLKNEKDSTLLIDDVEFLPIE